jgi:fatty acid CoA ligase FadD22
MEPDDGALALDTETIGDINIDPLSALGAEPISELSSIEPQSDAEAQPDDRPASDMQHVVGIAGEVTLKERLAALQQERHRLVLEAVSAEAAKMLGEPDPRSVNPDLAFSELGFDSKMTVELCNRLGVASGLRVPETVGWDYGSISGLARYLEAELSGDRRATSTLPGNANGLPPLEDELKKVEELVAAIPESEKQRVADRLRALLGTITDGEDRLGKRIQAASSPDEIFKLIDSQLGSDER